MAIGAREVAGEISTFQIMFFRSLIGLAVISLVIIKTKRNACFLTRRLKLHLGRNIFHFSGQYGWFLGIGLLPLAQVFALEFTTPLWTLIIASVFLGELLTVRKSAAILLGLVGVFLILNPGTEMVSFAALYVLGAAVLFSLSYVSTKTLAATDDPLTILFYMSVIQAPIGFLLGVSNFVSPSVQQLLWLTLIALAALSAHYCVAKAMITSEASVVVTMDFLRLPLIAVVGVALYGEPFKPILVVGAMLMLFGNLINMGKPKSRTPEA